MITPTCSGYLSDLSDAEGELVQPLLPPPASRGRPRRHSLRTLLTAIFYGVRAGGAWRLLPRDLPPGKTVYHSFRTWRLDGTWERIHLVLRERLRVRLGRDPQPSAGIIARPVGQDDQRRGRARLRRRQKGEGPQAPPARGYRRVGAGGQRAPSRHHGP
jgi:transposase